MTEAQVRALKVGDRVRWDDGTPGRVVAFDCEQCIVFRFDKDGDNSYLDVKDCGRVERAK